jgi:hypothetical protein
MRWFGQYRIEWIAETLRVFGYINRKHLERKFDISMQQASLDLNTFLKEHPDLMAYDRSKKCYVARDRDAEEDL